MLLFDTFNNDETNSFIGFSTVSNIELLIVSVSVLIILLFLANEINDKIKSSDTPDQKGLSLMEFLAAILVIIAYPTFEYTYNTLYRNATIHKAKVFEADYYQKLTSDEKDYFKLELLEKNELKDIDQIITDIKKQRETKKPPETTPDIENQLNKKFWELIQK